MSRSRVSRGAGVRLRLLVWLPALLFAFVVLGLAVAGGWAAARPEPPVPVDRVSDARAVDQASGFATMCARLFMSWDARDPSGFENALAPCVGSGTLDAGLGFTVPARGAQSVFWASVVQLDRRSSTDVVVTVAVMTSHGMRYVALPIRRYPGQGVGLYGYPALVALPRFVDGAAPSGDDADEELVAVARRALSNYLAGDATNLRADLVPDAEVEIPQVKLELKDVLSAVWVAEGSDVAVTVLAQDEFGGSYTLTYELRVEPADSSWRIERVETKPNQKQGGNQW